jgi:hypothetical protein
MSLTHTSGAPLPTTTTPKHSPSWHNPSHFSACAPLPTTTTPKHTPSWHTPAWRTHLSHTKHTPSWHTPLSQLLLSCYNTSLIELPSAPPPTLVLPPQPQHPSETPTILALVLLRLRISYLLLPHLPTLPSAPPPVLAPAPASKVVVGTGLERPPAVAPTAAVAAAEPA